MRGGAANMQNNANSPLPQDPRKATSPFDAQLADVVSLPFRAVFAAHLDRSTCTITLTIVCFAGCSHRQAHPLRQKPWLIMFQHVLLSFSTTPRCAAKPTGVLMNGCALWPSTWTQLDPRAARSSASLAPSSAASRQPASSARIWATIDHPRAPCVDLADFTYLKPPSAAATAAMTTA
eukprot:CAMPEP_0198537172 /NCGR_PEP_ID=MMETSP1462-20131121/43576_1 /TAXON_ID=1333877 /ORGANISM="Brandtodinium nutriculum, Strain RCC3387" /LENGTH=177 /DNA_ID=CAMNT_0044267157 /DNA_START=38 /DNA_END=568 /DNA_ORIENTATION=+